MVLRWRTIGHGYFDSTIGYHVQPITYKEAAENLATRHIMLTGKDQMITKYSLDDYFVALKNAEVSYFDFIRNQSVNFGKLRKHVKFYLNDQFGTSS